MSGEKPGGISFTLSKTKKGFVMPTIVLTEGKDGDPTNDDGLALKKTIIIPLKEGNEIGQKKQGAGQAPEVAYNPKGYGLQIRKKPDTAPTLPPTPYSTRSHNEPPASRTINRNEEEKLDDDLRVLPDGPSSKSYQEVPVEEFGLAMLRGMGWDESKAKRQTQEKPARLKQRPPMLGLGAKPGDPNLIKRPDYISSRSKNKSGRAGEEAMSIGSHVKIVKGEHSHMFGTVTKISKGMASLKLRSSAEHVMVDIEYIVSEALASELMPVSLEGTLLENYISGVYPGIKVQVISKTFNQGTLYLKAGHIIDVHLDDDSKLCSIQFSDGSVVHSVPHTVLKSIIPSVGGDVMVLKGPHSGHRASLLRLESDHKGVLQLAEDESIILTLSCLDFSCV